MQVTPREVRVLSPNGDEMLSALGVSKLRAATTGDQPQSQVSIDQLMYESIYFRCSIMTILPDL